MIFDPRGCGIHMAGASPCRRGCPYVVQRMAKSLDLRADHTQKLGARQQEIDRDAIAQLRKDLIKEQWLLHVMQAIDVKELSWDDIEFALCEFRKLHVGGPLVLLYRPRS